MAIPRCYTLRIDKKLPNVKRILLFWILAQFTYSYIYNLHKEPSQFHFGYIHFKYILIVIPLLMYNEHRKPHGKETPHENHLCILCSEPVLA